ncbi:hypothetical protein QQ045_010503 [Rhodiola kirilowii]
MDEDLRWNFSQWLPHGSTKLCVAVALSSFTDASSSSLTNALIISTDILLLFMLVYITVVNRYSKLGIHAPKGDTNLSQLRFVSAGFNACLGLAYVGRGIWIIFEEDMTKVSSSHFGAVLIVQGLIWSMLGLKLSLSRKRFPKVSLWIISVVSVLFAGTLCVSSLIAAVVNKKVTIYAALNIMSFPGAILLMICALKGYSSAETESVVDDNHLYMPLNGKVNGNVKAYDQITPFSGAGIFSKLSFWWLNPLMKKGVEKTLEDDDIPLLCDQDSAEACYVRFMEEFNKKKVTLQTVQPSILWTIVSCHWKDIFVSGFFALLKILTVSAGPLFLNAFIEVAQGNQSFKYEGYVLVISLFFSKSLGSLSQRQRIGKFPFWFHQTWTTSLQLCIALVIVFHAVGYATFAAFVVVIFTVVCNSPLAKLQHKFQSRLMAAQDERLKASSEALVNLRVLKLYAWETHFRNTIESSRKIEFKWLSAVQLRKSYNGFLFWSSPVLVSAATFGACYFLKFPLGASNVFTFVASLRLVQDPIRSIPDVIGVVIQAKVAFARIEKYLEAEELESDCVRTKGGLENSEYVISIKSANLSWEKNSAKPTLRNITLEVKSGERVAICGEVGSGKSTLLASILGEVPSTEGTEYVMSALAGKTVLLMSDGEIIRAAPYTDLLASSKEFQELVNAHKETAGSESLAQCRSISTVFLGLQSSKSLFTQLLNSLFRAPMSFYDSTPLGRILSRISSDLSIVDLDVPFSLIFAVGATTNAYTNLGVMAVVTWQVLFVSIPMVYE